MSDMQGRIVVITGATAGIGKAAARELVQRGANVTLVSRTAQRGQQAAQDIGASDFVVADLTELDQVRRAVDELHARLPRLDVLVNNAGAFHPRRRVNSQGMELNWVGNHLSAFLLTRELLPLLQRSDAPRVANTCSGAIATGRIHWDDPDLRRRYDAWTGYAQSKLGMALATRELARRNPWLQANYMNPGFVASEIMRPRNAGERLFAAVANKFAQTPEKGAETLLHLATNNLGVSGRYFANLKLLGTYPQVADDGAALRLWQLSEEYVDGKRPS